MRALAAVLASGCVSPGVVAIRSNAPNTRLRIGSSQATGALPPDGKIQLSTENETCAVEVSAAGYKPKTVTFTRTTSGSMVALLVGQCVLCPPIGLLIGLPLFVSNKKWRTMEPEAVSVTLERDASLGAGPGDPATMQPR